MRAHEGGYYIRLAVYDRPGAFAAIAQPHGRRTASRSNSIVQRRRRRSGTRPEHPMPDEPQPVILITYATTEAAMREALDAHQGATVILPASRR